MSAPRRIFIAHPSILLTDHLTHGDALTAYNFIRRLALRGHRLHVVAEHVALREALPDNVSLYPIPPRRPRSPTDQIRCAWRIRTVFDQVRSDHTLDIVHQLNPVDLGLSSFLPRTRPPLVLGPYVPDWPMTAKLADDATSLGRWAHLAARRLKDGLRWWQQRRSAAILLSTPAARTKLHVSGGALISYLSPGVDTERFAPPASDSRPRRDKSRILFLANLNVRKGILTLLEAFDHVADRIPGCELQIAGDGPIAGRVREVATSSPHHGSITLLGRVEPDAVPGLMRAADVFCLPSLAEPFGITALEAMACGKPVVATRVGGLGHLVRTEGGRIVPPGDSRSLAAALAELLGSVQLREEMGSFNREFVERTYSWDRVIDQLEDVYDHVLT